MSSNELRPEDDFAAKYECYGKMLYRISVVYLGNRADAEEAVQETFFRLFNKAPRFNDPEHEKAWLIKVATNLCKNTLAGFWRKRRASFSWEELAGAGGDPAEARMMDSVLRLPFKYKTAIHLHYYEGYAVKEIAAIVGATESAVKMRLQRGRQLLKSEWEGESSWS